MQLNSLLNLDSEEDSIKTLGVWWNPSTDSFSYRIKINENQKRSKRIFLSNMSKIFDPMGWLAPITLVAKLMMQEIWTAGQNWDEELSVPFQRRWTKFEKDLPILELLKIPRYLQTCKKSNIEIHGFCDASEKSYAAVVYVRIKLPEGYKTTLLGAKSRVAPLNKKQTIPRLELCVAVLLVQYIKELIKAFNFHESNINIFYWTDSKIVLAWIKGLPERWQPFVSHRVVEINQSSIHSQWSYVNKRKIQLTLHVEELHPIKLLIISYGGKDQNF